MMEREMQVIQFPLQQRNATIVNGVATQKPHNRAKYLNLIERFLLPDDYQGILNAIKHPLLYAALEPQLQKILDCYLSYDH
jgi:hypothetical protein